MTDSTDNGTTEGKTRQGPETRSEHGERASRNIKLRLIQTDNKPINNKGYIPTGDRDISNSPNMGNSRQGKGNLTVKQMEFAKAVAKGGTLVDAYRHAYETKTRNVSTISGKASMLASLPKIQSVIVSLRAEEEASALLDGPETGRLVVEFLRKTMAKDAAKDADRIRAAELLGKTHFTALFREITETVSVQRTDAEVKAELLQRLGRLAKG